MLAGAGAIPPEWAGKRSEYMQGRGGEASYGEPAVSPTKTLLESP